MGSVLSTSTSSSSSSSPHGRPTEVERCFEIESFRHNRRTQRYEWHAKPADRFCLFGRPPPYWCSDEAVLPDGVPRAASRVLRCTVRMPDRRIVRFMSGNAD